MNEQRPARRNNQQVNRLLQHLKKGSSGRLLFGEVNGELWWSDSYVALPVGPDMTFLLADYNLTPKPMACRVDRTIIRINTKGVDIAQFLPAKGTKLVTVEPLTMAGRELMYEDVLHGARVICSTDGKTATHTFARKLLDLVRSTGQGHLAIDPAKPHSPAFWVSDDGPTLGILKPVRIEGALYWSKAEAA